MAKGKCKTAGCEQWAITGCKGMCVKHASEEDKQAVRQKQRDKGGCKEAGCEGAAAKYCHGFCRTHAAPADLDTAREADRKYVEANADHIRQVRREWYREHREAECARQKAYMK
jgi:hypothetical protein